MDQNLITFRSVTYAQKGERSLQKRGIPCTLMRTPKWMEEQGCGYGLRVRGSYVGRALEALRKDQVSWRKVYDLSGDGKAEALR